MHDKAGTGSFVFTSSRGDSKAISVSAVNISGSTVTLTPSISPDGDSYELTVASNVLKDASNNPFYGISDSSYSFTVVDTTAPTVVGYNPAKGSISASTHAKIILTFDEVVVAVNGSEITLKAEGSTAGQVIPVNSSQVEVSGKLVTISPLSSLQAATKYTVTVPSGAFQDVAGVAFKGIASGNYSFTVSNNEPPELKATGGYSPVNKATGVSTNGFKVVLDFNKNMATGTGYITFVKLTGTAISPLSISVADPTQVPDLTEHESPLTLALALNLVRCQYQNQKSQSLHPVL